MQIKLTRKADKDYQKLPYHIQKKVDKQFDFLVENFRHPSLNAKLYDQNAQLWQARIDKSYRFYFYVVEPHYIVIALINHPK